MKEHESFFDSLCTDELRLAERELSAFIAAVSQLFGTEEAKASAEDWVDELELMDVPPPSTPRDWRTITIAASIRLASRLNVTHHDVSNAIAQSGAFVAPIPPGGATKRPACDRRPTSLNLSAC